MADQSGMPDQIVSSISAIGECRSLSSECHDFVKRNISDSTNAALLNRDSVSSSDRCEPFHNTLRHPRPAPQIQELVADHNKPHSRRLLSNIQHEDPSHRQHRIYEVCALPHKGARSMRCAKGADARFNANAKPTSVVVGHYPEKRRTRSLKRCNKNEMKLLKKIYPAIPQPHLPRQPANQLTSSPSHPTTAQQ